MQPFEMQATSEVAAPRDAIWDRVASIAGINDELGSASARGFAFSVRFVEP